MRPLTARQEEVLEFICTYVGERKFPPTIREISDAFAISVKGAYDHVKALEKKQAIRCNTNRSRAIEVLRPVEPEPPAPPVADSGIREIPMVGTVAAGTPLLAEENREGTVAVPESLLARGRHFAVRVRGDSMVGAGIMDGDTAIIEQRPTANDGDIVVALIDDAATLKRFFREPSRVRLEAENDAYSPIYTRDVRVLGVLAHLIRSYR